MNQQVLASDAQEISGLDEWCRRLVLERLAHLQDGSVRVTDGRGTMVFGSGQPSETPLLDLHVTHPRFFRRLLTGGTVGAGESYADGDWSCSDLATLVRVMVRNLDTTDRLEQGVTRIARGVDWLIHRLFRDNSKAGSRRNIAAHYDLGNRLFESFLDSRLMYSSAVFESEDEDLEQASLNKLQRIVHKLALGPDDHLLEIGTGWGGLAIHAARESGCRVTTTTISAEQHAFATAKVNEAGLSNRIDVLCKDYRDLSGTYSKLVSVEMVEAVGANHLDTWFGCIERLLQPQGLALVQAITIRDRRYVEALRSVDFIKKHVFPGSFIPSVSRLTASAAQSGGLVLVNLEDLADDYARTLAAWWSRFDAAWPALQSLGYDERFRRLWHFYLAYCEGGFRERALSDVQLLFAAPAWRGRPWRVQQAGSTVAIEREVH